MKNKHLIIGLLFSCMAIGSLLFGVWSAFKPDLTETQLEFVSGVATDFEEYRTTRRGHSTDSLQFSIEELRFETNDGDFWFNTLKQAVLERKEIELGIVPGEFTLELNQFYSVRIDGIGKFSLATILRERSEQRYSAIIVTLIAAFCFGVMAFGQFFAFRKNNAT